MKKINFSFLKKLFTFPNKVAKRRFIIRFLAILFIILLGVVMFFTGKGHTVNLANVQSDIKGVLYNPKDGIVVKFDDEEEYTSYSGFSDEITTVGAFHTLSVEYNGKEYKKNFKIPARYRNVIISLPAFIADVDNIDVWLSRLDEITVEPDTPVADEDVNTNFGM